MYYLLLVCSLLLIAFFHACAFYYLTGRAVSLRESIRISCATSALNKLLFSGTGFIFSGYLAKAKNISRQKIVGGFLVLELISVTPWLAMGCLFGAKIASRNIYIVSIFIFFLLFFFWLKRGKMERAFYDLTVCINDTGRQILGALPFILAEIVLFYFYYVCLYKILKVEIASFPLLKVIAISFTFGYLSPAPSGLGFKDATMAGLLLAHGVSAPHAGLVAVTDRLVMTGFWLLMALFVSADLLRNAWRSRGNDTSAML